MARQVMWFYLPTDIQAVISDNLNDRQPIPIYINPQDFNINEVKLIKYDLTKGGYMVQYWGEQLTEISVSGATGSGGIEAVNILRDVYRYEQRAFKNILAKRASEFASSSTEAIEDSSNTNTALGLTNAIDQLFNGAATSIVDGTASVISEISDAINGVSSINNRRVALIPTLASFAVSMIIYFQGVKYKGFFKNFNITETAASPGLFNYKFDFVVTKSYGERKNFMPWHRSPYDAGGEPRQASIPIIGAATNELSFPTEADYSSTQEGLISERQSSSFRETAEGDKTTNNVGINRREKFK